MNKSTVTHKGDHQQWAIMLLKNSMISPDTLNAITFLLTAGAAISKKRDLTVTFNAKKIKSVASVLISLPLNVDDQNMVTLSNDVKSQCLTLFASAER